MRVIGLLGAAGSGKSVASEYLVEKYGAKLYTFARPLKEIIRLAFDLTENQVYGTQKQKETVDPRYGVSPRWLMQRIGTEGVRNVMGSDFWWEYCMGQILTDNPELAVIDDFRFQNEVNGFLSLNESGISEDIANVVEIWRMEAPEGSAISQADPNHQSEAEWTKCQYTRGIKPHRWGLSELYDCLDEAAYAAKLPMKVNTLT